MAPFDYIPFLNNRYQSEGFPPYNWSTYDSAPWAPLAKPLRECRVAIVASGGMSLPSQRPFEPFARNDLTVLEIPRETKPEDLVINHGFYCHIDADRDPACVFPLWTLQELAQEGYIGDVAEHHYPGFMGRIYTRTTLMKENVPELVAKLREDGVDVLLLVPA